MDQFEREFLELVKKAKENNRIWKTYSKIKFGFKN